MRIAALLTPTPDWAAIVASARMADEGGGPDRLGEWLVVDESDTVEADGE
jgi:hypothetical protein